MISLMFLYRDHEYVRGLIALYFTQNAVFGVRYAKSSLYQANTLREGKCCEW